MFGFGRSFANSLLWDTPWSDFAGLFELADELQKTKFIWDEEERFACFSWTLCNHQRRDGDKKNNFLLILLRYVLEKKLFSRTGLDNRYFFPIISCFTTSFTVLEGIFPVLEHPFLV